MKPDYRKRVFFLLWVLALHSLGVAAGLIFLPTKHLHIFGFLNYSGHFFQTQSGIFHIVMSIAYLLAAYQMERSPGLVHFSIAAKTIGTVFLFITYTFFLQSIMVLFSAVVDGIMALTLFLVYRTYRLETNLK